MDCPHFTPFRLVGGTALSLRLGHRMSEDIDLFTDALYGSVDFEQIEDWLRQSFTYYHQPFTRETGMGSSYFIGNSKEENIKLDLYYTDNWVRPETALENIRMADVEDILAMKTDIIQRIGRKKDFWDLYETLDAYPPKKLIALHAERYPFAHDENLIRKNFTNFTSADDDFEPVCLRGRHWEIIKLEMTESVEDTFSV
jgi:predicted nucleotidyltransferase component of viral defense system